MKKRETPLADAYLQSFTGMQPINTDDFFYTRLQAKMESRFTTKWVLPIKPVWALGTLSILLIINGAIAVQQFIREPTSQAASTLQGFAATYDLATSTNY